MLTKLTSWIVGREPVATATGIAAVVTALAGVLTAFDVVELSAEQIAAIGAFAAAIAGWAGRSAVSPVKPPPPRGEYAGGTFEAGSIPLALIILVVVGVLIIGGAAASCDALFTDADEPGDLNMAPALVASHEYDDGCWEGECYSYDERNGGNGDRRGGDGRFGGGRSGDMEQGDGRNCRNFCDNVIYIPDPRGGEEERPR